MGRCPVRKKKKKKQKKKLLCSGGFGNGGVGAGGQNTEATVRSVLCASVGEMNVAEQ